MHSLQPNRPSASGCAHTAHSRQLPQTDEILCLMVAGTLHGLQQHTLSVSATSPSNPSAFRRETSDGTPNYPGCTTQKNHQKRKHPISEYNNAWDEPPN